MKIPKTVILNGMFEDQKGTAKRGKITGYNGNGIPCRKYTWTKHLTLKGKTFEAFDTQIENAIIKVFDNGGKTCDRYTVIINGHIFTMSDDANTPQGVNIYHGVVFAPVLDPVVDPEKWPEGVKLAIENRLAACM